ncbi:MAG TPA: hypothetical protein VFW19_10495 [Allosphingosinicella sp.]|nr:hypothetical protein [Allosphingosinicella sp.]
MSDRKYSVREIARMRHAVREIGASLSEIETEARLQTYMLNGTDPEELVTEAERISAMFEEARRNYEARKAAQPS